MKPIDTEIIEIRTNNFETLLDTLLNTRAHRGLKGLLKKAYKNDASVMELLVQLDAGEISVNDIYGIFYEDRHVSYSKEEEEEIFNDLKRISRRYGEEVVIIINDFKQGKITLDDLHDFVEDYEDVGTSRRRRRRTSRTRTPHSDGRVSNDGYDCDVRNNGREKATKEELKKTIEALNGKINKLEYKFEKRFEKIETKLEMIKPLELDHHPKKMIEIKKI